MKKHWMRIFQVCAIAIAIRHGLRAQSPDERIQKLVVMIDGTMGDSPTLGAGIIFGIGSDRLYIVTANHVVRRGADEAKNLHVQLRWLPGEPRQATLLRTSDPNLDLAVLTVTGLNQIAVTNGTVPFDLLGEVSSLKRGDPAHTLGYPSGRAWEMPVSADRVATSSGGSIQFESAFLYPGNSGGALLNQKYELIGLVRKDEPPNGEAANIDTVIDRLKTWGYPISLRRSAAANVVPSGPATVNGGVSGDRTAGNRTAKPNLTAPSVTISSATCSVVGPNTFRIEMAGKAAVPPDQTYLFYAEVSGPGGGMRIRPVCQSWGPADASAGALWNVSCIHTANAPSETSWRALVTVKLSQKPDSAYAGMIWAGKKAGGAERTLACAP